MEYRVAAGEKVDVGDLLVLTSKGTVKKVEVKT